MELPLKGKRLKVSRMAEDLEEICSEVWSKAPSKRTEYQKCMARRNTLVETNEKNKV
jgi:hypothetical protein